MKKRSSSSDQSIKNANQQKNTHSSSRMTIVKEKWRYYFDDGRQAYNSSQFKEAIDYFTQAIKLQPKNTTLLDCRAATYEKLKDWGAAIQDASLMIELAPEASKGYLRLGKLLTLQNRYSSALNIYRRGHKKVDKTDARYQTILSLEKSMEDKINIQQNYIKKQSDPIQLLPYDVLDMIFSQLPFHRRVICTQVSRSWRHFLHNWSGMWKDLDFITGAMKHNAVSRKTLMNYFSYTKGRHIRRFQLSANESKASLALKLLVDHDCQYIEYLGFVDTALSQNQFLRTVRLMGKNLTYLCLDDCNTTLQTVFMDILDICPHMTHIYYVNPNDSSFIIPEYKKTYNLQYLHLATNINDSTLDYLLQNCPLLTHLILPNTTIPIDSLFKYSLNRLNVLYYDTQPTSSDLPYWRNASTSLSSSSLAQSKGLIEFIIKRCYNLADHQLIPFLEKHRTTLQVLNLNRSTGFSNAWCSVFKLPITTVIPNNKNSINNVFTFPLRELHLQYCNSLTESDWISIISNCPHIQIIVACFIEQITNNVLEVMSFLPSLEYVDISTCVNVNGIGVRQLVDNRRLTLKRLILNNCTSIRHDAIQYAKSILGDRSVICTFTQK